MESYVDQLEKATEVHHRITAIELILRYLEDKLRAEVTDNSAALQALVARMEAYTLSNLSTLMQEECHLQKSTVSSALLLFVILCRLELHRHEPSWRETDAHLKLRDISQAAILDDEIDPILFCSCSKIHGIIERIQQHWYTHAWDVHDVCELIKWLERRVSLLITFPFDEETMDLPQYRQKHRDGFLTNMAYIWDMHAFFLSVYRDIRRYHALQEVDRRKAPQHDATKATAFLHNVINNIQGDSLCISFQKLYVEAQVRVGHATVAHGRRPEVVTLRAMDIIQECCGIEYSREVHKNADVRLLDILDKPTDVLLLVCYEYFAQQKYTLPWMQSSVVHRFKECASYTLRITRPTIIFVPVANQYMVQTSTALWECTSCQQALLHWMTLMQASPTIPWQGRNYNISAWISDCL